MPDINSRKANYPIHDMFLERWSPRAMTGEPIQKEDLFTMLEAARWAASSYNSQPWRFLYALRNTPSWERFLDLLVPFNQSWAKGASALVFWFRTQRCVPHRAATRSLHPHIRSTIKTLQQSRFDYTRVTEPGPIFAVRLPGIYADVANTKDSIIETNFTNGQITQATGFVAAFGSNTGIPARLLQMKSLRHADSAKARCRPFRPAHGRSRNPRRWTGNPLQS